MITLRDNITLAFTKLRTRKVRLIVTIVVSGLLFTGLMGASIIIRGSFQSIASFSEEGFGQRYIVAANEAVSSSGEFYNDPALLDRATALQKELTNRKKTEAKRLGLTYEPASEPPAVSEYDGPSGKQRMVNFESPVGRQVLEEYATAHPPKSMQDFEQNALPFGAKTFYTSRLFPFVSEGRLQVLKDNKENFEDSPQMTRQGPPTGLDAFASNWSIMDSRLLEPFILKGQDLRAGGDGSIPIIVPNSAAEQLTGLKALPSTAGSKEKLERIKELRAKAASISFDVCIRNATSLEQINSAVNTQQEIARNASNKEYVKPELIYGLPSDACGAVPISRDVRSKDQKTLDAKQEEFDRIFGKPAPSQTIVKFRVVGIVPDFNFQAATGAEQIISSMVTSTLGNGWYTPLAETEKHPVLKSLMYSDSSTITQIRPTYYAEFSTPGQATKFIDEASCVPQFNSDPRSNPYAECQKPGLPFALSAFGSNSLALTETERFFNKAFGIAAIVVAAIGSIIMMGTVGRMVADSRRETAVFRAIGAKRLDIAQTYLFYTFILSLMISAFAAGGGLLLASIAQHKFASDLTAQALVAYNAQDFTKTFQLFGFHLPDFLYMIGLAAGIGLLSVSIPLLRNVRRNPIRDMRDDT